MGFDKALIVNVQSLHGEYFCPVCRLLVYPNEALQLQCTHLFCKPCLAHLAGTSRACPYCGYLVTEADSKPLVESHKSLAETIGKIAVQCLYHLSGCKWEGPLSECSSHCSGCGFGNSPVVCNWCDIDIMHRQVREHEQNCPLSALRVCILKHNRQRLFGMLLQPQPHHRLILNKRGRLISPGHQILRPRLRKPQLP